MHTKQFCSQICQAFLKKRIGVKSGLKVPLEGFVRSKTIYVHNRKVHKFILKLVFQPNLHLCWLIFT